ANLQLCHQGMAARPRPWNALISAKKNPQAVTCGSFRYWRPMSESNRRTRICNPLHNHSANRPQNENAANCCGVIVNKLERETRLELATPTLARSCSTN